MTVESWTNFQKILVLQLLWAFLEALNKLAALPVGSTATVCLLQDNYMLHIGHVGDSRAILCRDNTVRILQD